MQRLRRGSRLFWVIMAVLIIALMSTGGGCGGGGNNGGGGDGDVTNMATLTVRVFLPPYDENGEYKKDADPAPAGIIINVNDDEYGLTGDDGTLAVKVPAGSLEVDARRYPGEIGWDSIVLEPGEHGQIDIFMHEGKEPAENSTLVIDQLRDGVLDRNFSGLTARFISRAGAPVALEQVSWVQLVDPGGSAGIFVDELFTLRSDGTLILNDVAAFKKLLSKRSGEILLNVRGYDTGERTHDQTVEFYIGSYKVAGRLVAPPSNPSLNTGGISISANLLGTDLVFNVVSDASGYFEFPPLPEGILSFKSVTVQNGEYYRGQGMLVVNDNKSLTVTMLHFTDMVNDVPSFTVTSDGASAVTQPDPERERRHQEWEAEFLNEQSLAPADDDPDPTIVSVYVVSNEMDAVVKQKATLSVPKGTETVKLTYSVATAEYPIYVLAKSVFNDTWGINVKGKSEIFLKFQRKSIHN